MHLAQDAEFASEPGGNRREASITAGGVGECWSLSRLLLRPIGIEEIKDAANRPIAHRNPENESNDDGEEQKERKQERRHIPLILQRVRATPGFSSRRRGLRC